MISIFNGRERRLGKTTDRIYAQFDVAFRRYVHLFKNARLHVFLEIALHSDEWGFSWPSAATICRNTGYGEDTVWYAIRDLESLTLEGARVLQRYAARAAGNRVANNVYLVFPTAEELERYQAATFRIIDEPPRGRALRIALRDGVPYPPDFPYSENPMSAFPDRGIPSWEMPTTDAPAMDLPHTDEPGPEAPTAADPGTKEIDQIGDSSESNSTPYQTPGEATTTTAAAALRTFSEANGRPPNAIEHRALTRVAGRCTGADPSGPADGWLWVQMAIVEAVESGSSFVAPRRVDAICERWLAEGFPQHLVRKNTVPRTSQSDGSPRRTNPRVRTAADEGPTFWSALLHELRPYVSRQAHADSLRQLRWVDRVGDLLVAEVDDPALAEWIAGRYGPLLEKVGSAMLGEPIRVEIRASAP